MSIENQYYVPLNASTGCEIMTTIVKLPEHIETEVLKHRKPGESKNAATIQYIEHLEAKNERSLDEEIDRLARMYNSAFEGNGNIEKCWRESAFISEKFGINRDKLAWKVGYRRECLGT